MPLALVINKLLTNACKHHRRVGENSPSVTVDVAVDERTFELTIMNTNPDVPPDFDFSSTAELGSGLDLVKSLLPREGAKLSITRNGTRVRTRLTLMTPSLVFDKSSTQGTRSQVSTFEDTTSETTG